MLNCSVLKVVMSKFNSVLRFFQAQDQAWFSKKEIAISWKVRTVGKIGKNILNLF